jgi:predicted HTH domain antitoxin
MNERITITIPSELNEELERMQKEMKLDKSSIIRQFLMQALEEWKKKTTLNAYKAGKITIGKAAEQAGISLWEFLELCNSQQIQLDFTIEDAKHGIEIVNKTDFQKYKQ